MSVLHVAQHVVFIANTHNSTNVHCYMHVHVECTKTSIIHITTYSEINTVAVYAGADPGGGGVGRTPLPWLARVLIGFDCGLYGTSLPS